MEWLFFLHHGSRRYHSLLPGSNGGTCTVSGGTITGTVCAIRNSGNTLTKYQNGVPVGKVFSRGILSISGKPTLGKVILEYPEAFSVNNNCGIIIDLELDMDDIALGDTICTSGTHAMDNLNLLNEGYVLLYDYYDYIYLETNHCGATEADDLHWKMTPDGRLTIFGTGKMKNYSVSVYQPWNKEKTGIDITEVILESGITHIGNSAFAYLDGLTKIVIPEGVTTIGTWVFEGSNNLEEVHLPSTLTSIGKCFFATIDGTAPPAAVYYNGCREHQWANVAVGSVQPAAVEPICLENENTDDGDCTTELTCSVCETVMIPARESHTGGTATCTELAQCDVCGMAYGQLGHVSVVVPAVDNDCENDGLTEGAKCQLCDAVLVAQTVIPATGHSHEAVTTPPTCEDQGFTTHTCHCGNTYTDSYVDALGHYVLGPGTELVDAHTLQNDSAYPFTLSGGWYASTNKSHSTSSAFQINAIYDCTLTLKYKVSSENSYDKLQILLNGAIQKTASGEVSETLWTVELKAGDVVSIQYSKDHSVSRGDDTGYFMIESITQVEKEIIVQIPVAEAEPTCTEAVICQRCQQTLKPALGHDYWDGTCNRCGGDDPDYIPLTIVTQPETAVVPNGATATVQFQAIGNDLTYTWYYKNKGAAAFTRTGTFTGDTYTAVMNTSRNGRQIYCVVTDKYGNTAQTDTVTISLELTITLQPETVVVPNGSRATVRFQAMGDGLTYTWYYKGKGDAAFTSTASFKSNVYSVVMNGSRNGRQVYCVVTDKYGNSVQTDTVFISQVLTITGQPQSVVVPKGSPATVRFQVLGDGLTYTWYYRNKGEDTFAVTDTFKSNGYSVIMNPGRDGRQVYCLVTDRYGNSVQTDTVTIHMEVSLKITVQPESVVAANGATATVRFQAEGDGLTYAWYYKNKGATTFTLTKTFTSSFYSVSMNLNRDGRQVYCVVTDRYGNTVQTDTVTISVQRAIQITSQPESVTAAEGTTAKVQVKATGVGLTYTWYYRNKGQTAFTLTKSFTSNAYFVTMNASRDDRDVYCVITDSFGNRVETDIVTLSMA